MSKPLPTTSHAVLGLLSMFSMSGYQLASFASHSIAHFWPISKSQVYSELSRLEELGYVEGTDVRQERLPDKRLFKLTPLGETILDEWLADPAYETERFRSGFLVKFFFAGRMPREHLLAMVTQYREANTHALERFKPMTAAIPPGYPKLTAQLGLKHLHAQVEWADEVIAELKPKRRRKAGGR